MEKYNKDSLVLLRIGTENGLDFLYIMRNTVSNKYHFVNFMHNIIDGTEYNSVSDAIDQIEKLKQQGKILWYQNI